MGAESKYHQLRRRAVEISSVSETFAARATLSLVTPSTTPAQWQEGWTVHPAALNTRDFPRTGSNRRPRFSERKIYEAEKFSDPRVQTPGCKQESARAFASFYLLCYYCSMYEQIFGIRVLNPGRPPLSDTLKIHHERAAPAQACPSWGCGGGQAIAA